MHRCILIFLLMLSLQQMSFLHAQTVDTSRVTVATDSVSILRSLLEEKRSERIRMERILTALNTVDSVYKIHYPTWVILDDDLRERLIKAFSMRYPDVPRDSTVTIITSPSGDEILQISIGTAIMGRRETHVNLSDSLHAELLAARYPLRVIDTIPPKQRPNVLFGMTPKFVAISASAFGAAILFSDRRGVEVRLGHEEIGYHFWSTGDFSTMLIFKQLKLGIMVPFRYGNTQPGIISPLSIRARRLNGSRGLTAEFEQPFSNQSLGARFSVGELHQLTDPDLFTDPVQLYYLHTVAQLFYTRREALGEGTHVFTLKGGVGYHQIALGQTLPDTRITAIEKQDFLSPILGVDYLHQGSTMYGLGVQYYSSILFATGWLEVIKNFIYVDLKYYTPVFRSPKPWEQAYFFMISPRIQLVY